MAIINSYTDDFGKRLCDVLGLDSSKTQDIIIKVVPDDVIRVEVVQLLQDKESGELLHLLEKYVLTKPDDGENNAPST